MIAALERGPRSMLLRPGSVSSDLGMLWDHTPSDRSESDLMSIGASLVEEIMQDDESTAANISADAADGTLVTNPALTDLSANDEALLGIYFAPWLT